MRLKGSTQEPVDFMKVQSNPQAAGRDSALREKKNRIPLAFSGLL
jgi:hypothetical protein